MVESLPIISERVDDIPLVLAQLARMDVRPLLDENFPTHGNWVGLSFGWVTVIGLTPIWSDANHWLHHVEPWAAVPGNRSTRWMSVTTTWRLCWRR